MTMHQIINFMNVYPQIKNNKIKIQTAYKISKCVEFCEKEIEFYNTELKKIFESYGEKDSDGNFKCDETTGEIMVKPDKWAECSKEINELLNLEVSFDDKLLIDLNDVNDFTIDVDSFRKIQPFLKD